MPDIFTEPDVMTALASLFNIHKNERICVIGTMCCGKTTLIRRLSQYNCVDVDDEFWHRIPEEKIRYLSQTPITGEIIGAVCTLMREKVTVKPGFPLFGVAIHDCDVFVYLDITNRLLKEHCEKRGDTTLSDALFVKKYIEEEISIYRHKNDKAFCSLTIKE